MNFIYRYGDKNKTIHTVVKKKTLLTKKVGEKLYLHILGNNYVHGN